MEIDLDELRAMPFSPGGRRPGTLGNHEFIALYLYVRGEPVRYKELQRALSGWRKKDDHPSWGVSYFHAPRTHYAGCIFWPGFRGVKPDRGYWWQPDIWYTSGTKRVSYELSTGGTASFDAPRFKQISHNKRGYRLTGKGLSLAAEALAKVLLRRD